MTDPLTIAAIAVALVAYGAWAFCLGGLYASLQRTGRRSR